MDNYINKYISNNKYIDLVGSAPLKHSIEHVFIPTKNKNKDEVLVELLSCIKPYLALIFANTVEKVDEISNWWSVVASIVNVLTIAVLIVIAKKNNRKRKC